MKKLYNKFQEDHEHLSRDYKRLVELLESGEERVLCVYDDRIEKDDSILIITRCAFSRKNNDSYDIIGVWGIFDKKEAIEYAKAKNVRFVDPS